MSETCWLLTVVPGAGVNTSLVPPTKSMPKLKPRMTISRIEATTRAMPTQ